MVPPDRPLRGADPLPQDATDCAVLVVRAPEADDRRQDDTAQVVEDELDRPELVDGERRRVPHERAHRLAGDGHGHVVGQIPLARPGWAERDTGHPQAHLAHRPMRSVTATGQDDRCTPGRLPITMACLPSSPPRAYDRAAPPRGTTWSIDPWSIDPRSIDGWPIDGWPIDGESPRAGGVRVAPVRRARRPAWRPGGAAGRWPRPVSARCAWC